MNNIDYPVARQFHENTSYLNENSGGEDAWQPAMKTGEKDRPTRIKLDLPVIPDSHFSDLLLARHSCRQFNYQPITLKQLINILFAGYGIRDTMKVNDEEWLVHTVPSAGALFPLEFYILVFQVAGLSPGIYHYLPKTGELAYIQTEPVPIQLVIRFFLNQSWIAGASAIIIATAVIERTLSKYLDRGYRYILLEAGHAFQNMNLMAAACNIGAVNIGAFYDNEIAGLLNIADEEELPIYATVLGNRVEGS